MAGLYPVVLILVMIFRPQGLLGTKEMNFVKTFDKLRGFIAKKIGGEKEDGK